MCPPKAERRKRMNKKHMAVIMLAVSLAVVVAVFAGCGEPVRGEDGRNGLKGRDGLSTYEIFCKNYIYIESEKQWLDDLMNGELERVDNSVLDDKIYWNGDIDTQFIPGKISLVVDKYFYQKEFTAEDFHMIDVEKVEASYYNDYSTPNANMYSITLKDKSTQGLADAIWKLEIYAFTHEASPSYLVELA